MPSTPPPPNQLPPTRPPPQPGFTSPNHIHDYTPLTQPQAERRTRWVLGLTLVTMVLELVVGYATGSMALTADGWHMGTHATALGVAALAYVLARRNRGNPRFTFGTGKVGALGAFASTLLLAGVAVWVALESAWRLMAPQNVDYPDALTVAALGLVVNLVSAWLLSGQSLEDSPPHPHGLPQGGPNLNAPPHQGGHLHGHTHGHVHEDQNLRAAYVHVLTDALTSVLALVALVGGWWWGVRWLDPTMGLVGAVLIAWWAWGLGRDSALVLVDAPDHSALAQSIQQRLETAGARVLDLHLWQMAPGSVGCIVSVLAPPPGQQGVGLQSPEHYKALLADLPGLAHLTVEVNPPQ